MYISPLLVLLLFASLLPKIFVRLLLRLGLIGPEYKNVRMHLLKRLPGDPAWLRDRNQYESYQRRHTHGGER